MNSEKKDTIIFECPECGKKLGVGKDKAGIKARCPNCGKRISIPKNKKNK